jgi:hypothetical protein
LRGAHLPPACFLGDKERELLERRALLLGLLPPLKQLAAALAKFHISVRPRSCPCTPTTKVHATPAAPLLGCPQPGSHPRQHCPALASCVALQEPRPRASLPPQVPAPPGSPPPIGTPGLTEVEVRLFSRLWHYGLRCLRLASFASTAPGYVVPAREAYDAFAEVFLQLDVSARQRCCLRGRDFA